MGFVCLGLVEIRTFCVVAMVTTLLFTVLITKLGWQLLKGTAEKSR